MSTVESYHQGVPCWVDLLTPDVEATRTFYGELFGWEYDARPMPMESGETAYYYMAALGGRNAAGLMQAPEEGAGAPSWRTYFAVDDAEASAARIPELGGTVLLPLAEIPGSGRMTIAVDAGGAVFGLWQAQGHIGSAAVNEAGAPIWHELQSDDAPAAATFYESLTGDGREVTSMGEFDYISLTAEGKPAAGIMPKQDSSQPTDWLVYFGVDDVDASAAQAEALGGSVLEAPYSIEGVGRMAVLADPQGVVFAIMNGAA
jgi:predicted enzyme related to lactoylglutathione lyase